MIIVRMAEFVHCGIDKSLLPQRFFFRGESDSRCVSCCLNRSSVRNEQPVHSWMGLLYSFHIGALAFLLVLVLRPIALHIIVCLVLRAIDPF